LILEAEVAVRPLKAMAEVPAAAGALGSRPCEAVDAPAPAPAREFCPTAGKGILFVLAPRIGDILCFALRFDFFISFIHEEGGKELPCGTEDTGVVAAEVPEGLGVDGQMLDCGSSGSDAAAGAISHIPSPVKLSPSGASSNPDTTRPTCGSSPAEWSMAEASDSRGQAREAHEQPTGERGTPAAAGFSGEHANRDLGIDGKGDLDGRNGLIQGKLELELRASGGGGVDGDTEISGVSCDGGAETVFEASGGSTAPVQEGVDRMETSLDDSEASDGSTTQDSDDTDVETESSTSSVEDQDTGYIGVHVPRMVCLPCKLL
jgi:hypothetical protein